ncbi:MAG: hypothetical protein AB1942_11385 [Pseudomonadota bacterium]
MRIRTLAITAGIGAALMLSGCDKVKGLMGGGGEPKGQVVATVNGEEVTALELRAELGGFSSRDPEVVKAAQQQALQRIILRRLMAQEAKKDKLDKTPDFAIQMKRGEETLLAQLYQRKLAAAVSQPTRQEAEAYVAAHPDQFANRQVLVIDQVLAGPNKIPPERFRPLKTLDEVKALLAQEGVPYQTNAATMDTVQANPQLLEQIKKLPPGEVFVIPQGGALIFNQINGSRSVPFQGDMAINYALQTLRGQKAQESVGKKIEAMRKAAEKGIVYNAAYKPPPPGKAPATPAAKAPAAGATTAPAAAPAAAAPAPATK